MQLENSTVFITGATSGFGEACARLLVRQGARVIASGRRGERLDTLKQELGSKLEVLTLDVRDRASVEKAVAAYEIDALVNNAGLALGLSSFEHTPMEELEQMVDTNIKGVLYCTYAALPGMVARDHGHIINLGSVAGNYPYPGSNVYGATKAFIAQLSLNLRADLLGKNIRVTNIEPGMSETEFSLTRFHGDAGKASAVYAGIEPLQAQDVAEAIVWCLTRPPHVNINHMELMPVMQAFGPLAVKRK